MRGIRLMLAAAVALLASACAPFEAQVRDLVGPLLFGPVRDLQERPTLRETPDGCAADPKITNPQDQRLEVTVSYRAFDADGQELPELRVNGLVPEEDTVVLHGDITPGLPCARIGRIEIRNAHLDFR